MRVAELLSDFNSLRPGVCDPKAALELVSAKGIRESKTPGDSLAPEQDKELDRVKDLLELHASMKQTHTDGVNAELKQARDVVHKVLQGL